MRNLNEHLSLALIPFRSFQPKAKCGDSHEGLVTVPKACSSGRPRQQSRDLDGGINGFFCGSRGPAKYL